MSNKQITLLGLLTLFLVAACSTEKNTLLSRSYHSTTAHYNGYFNANDLLSEAMKSYRGNLKEDYYSVLTIRTLPNEEEVKNMYTPIDTAIAKCTKVIQKHAMPGMDKPSKKKEEHNKWIDENWTTIGIANYYRRDYAVAMKNFEYVQKFFSNDKSTYVAELWMAKTNIQEGRFTEANFNLSNLDKAVEESTSKSKKSKSKKSKKTKKADKEDEVAEFPKKLRFELEITRAQFFEAKKDVDGEIKALEASLEFVKKSSDKARIHFILGQLYEGKGDRGAASDHYNKALKSNGGYEMNFNARLKRALNGGSSDVEKDLNKMLRDEKNAEFKDQIYYTLGLISQNEGKEDKAIERFTSSAFYSTNNNRQKGMAYERLGDTYFQKKDYVKAQKYYDSCATVIPETYPNAEGVRNKALKLQDLVTAIETAQYEDSVQRIASLSEEDRYAFAEKLVKQIKEEEERQKRLNEDRARQLQDLANKAEEGAGNKWYWNNPKAKEEGFKEFKRQWGQRVNEDDWRRSDKVVLGFNNEDDTLSEGGNTPVEVEVVDSLTPESLLAKLPLSDSLLQGSRERMMSAYFDAGRIYQDQLNEEKLAEKQYNIILGKQFESDYKLLSAYQIYKMYDPAAPQAVEQKNYILTNYPTSDFAGYLRDPDYFLKKKEREKLAQQEYLTVLDRYERGLYYPVLLKANTVITGEKENQYRAKYFLLKAKCQAKLNEDKKTLLPTLDSLIAEYPGTDEAKNAADMRNIILNGFSANLPVDFNKPSMYKYDENDEMNVLVFLEADSKVSSTVAKTRVADFNKEFYGREKLMTSSKVFGKQSVILVKEFKSEDEAAMYLAQFKKTKKHLLDLQKAKIVFISTPNMKTLFETMKLEEYERFFEDKY
jgi:tetratricopeptide (TPR) repeat protein